jgi:hypothetical protein
VIKITTCGNYNGACIEGNCINGQGTMTWLDGKKYVGEFKDGKYNGQGTLRYPDGRVDRGIWKNNEIEK